MRKIRFAGVALAGLTLFAGGYAAGQGTANKFGQPHTVLQISISSTGREQRTRNKRKCAGLKQMAAQIPGDQEYLDEGCAS